MKFSAACAARKWPYGDFCSGGSVIALAAALVIHASVPAFAAVPLPQPRPAEAPQEQQGEPLEKPADAVKSTPEPPPPSPCRLALTDAIAIAPSLPPITGPGACGGDDIVRLEAVVLNDGKRVPLKPAATLRCTMATAVAEWVRNDMAALAAGLGTSVSELDNFDSFDCRGRNRVAGAKMSEHGRANALDVRGLKLANGQSIALTDRGVDRALREQVLASLCARFSTVLGPGSDWYHEDHIHLDLAERRSNYKLCQWNVWEPLPAVAPLLPALRPEEAPPREVAAKPDDKPVVQSAPAQAQPVPLPQPAPARVEPVKPESAVRESARPEPAPPEPKSSKSARPQRATSEPAVDAANIEPPPRKSARKKLRRARAPSWLPPFLR